MSLPETGNKILIVEDDKRILDILVHELSKEGYDIRTTSNGYEAGFLVRSTKPDLIFLDIFLPGGRGQST